ncbi:hypothetical protein ABIF97_006193 [Bradyrhizobium japonicum]
MRASEATQGGQARFGDPAIGCKPASAMRAGNSAITASRSVLSMACQRAISGKVRPQPKHSLVFGSIMQTATHGVSLLMWT